jgi:hypothetical protein
MEGIKGKIFMDGYEHLNPTVEVALGCHTSHCLIVALVAREKATMR